MFQLRASWPQHKGSCLTGKIYVKNIIPEFTENTKLESKLGNITQLIPSPCKFDSFICENNDEFFRLFSFAFCQRKLDA